MTDDGAQSSAVDPTPNSSDAGTTHRRKPSRRRWVIIGVATLLVAVMVTLWVVASRVQSQAQRDAVSTPPPVGVVAVPVVTGDLTDVMTASATVAAPAQGSRAILAPEGSRAVVTRGGTSVGQPLTAGTALLWVNSRPVIVMPGDFPAYRDLYQGDQGDDVAQLQRALGSLGYSLTADGVFGPATARAVTSLYHQLGVPVDTGIPPTDDAQVSQPRANSGQASTESSSGSTSDGQAVAPTPVVTIPMTEMVFIPGLASGPILTSVPEVGSIIGGDDSVVTYSVGRQQLRASMPSTTAEQLSLGARAWITTAAGQIDFTITEIAPASPDTAPGTSNGSTGGTQEGTTATNSIVTFTPVDDVDLTQNTGTTVVSIERTPTLTGVLLIPKRGIVDQADRSSAVLKQSADGNYYSEPVTVSSCVGGQCAVEGNIAAGDLIRVDQ